jgi:hypothetical protein
VARGDLIFGKPAAGHTVFHIGSESVAVTTDECPGVVALDFGRDADCFFVFTPPATEEPRPGRSRRRKNGKPAT